MKTSESIAELSAALAKAQAQLKNPEKNRTAKIPTKSGGSYQYHYADLPSTYDAVRKALSENGLSHASGTTRETSETILSMRLMHASGEWIESSLPLPASHDPKALAANLTYFRRYLFIALVGIAGDDDVDGEPEHEGAQYGHKSTVSPKKQTGTPKAQQEKLSRQTAISAALDAVKKFEANQSPKLEKCSEFIPPAGKLTGRALGEYETETLKKYASDVHLATAQKKMTFDDLPEITRVITRMVEAEIKKRENKAEASQ